MRTLLVNKAVFVSLFGILALSFSIAQTTEAEWQSEAMRQFPELAESDSLLLKFFRLELTRNKAANQDYFKNPKWPLLLAQQCVAKCDKEATEAEWQREAIRQFSDLARNDSPLLKFFRSELGRLKTQDSKFFMNPKWPFLLTQQCAANPDTASVLVAANPPANRLLVSRVDPSGRITNLGLLFGQTLTISDDAQANSFYDRTSKYWQEKPKPKTVYIWKGKHFVPVTAADLQK